MPKTLFESDYEHVFGIPPSGSGKTHKKAAKTKIKKQFKDKKPKKLK